MVTTSSGDYAWKWYVSFTGETETEFHIRNLTNGVPTGAESIRTIGSEPSIGSMSAFGGGRLPSGATNSFEFKASTDGAWISLQSFLHRGSSWAIRLGNSLRTLGACRLQPALLRP